MISLNVDVVLYTVYDILHIVVLMSYIQRVLYRRKSLCDDTHSVAVMSYTMDMMSSYILDEISKFSWCDMINTVDVMT